MTLNLSDSATRVARVCLAWRTPLLVVSTLVAGLLVSGLLQTRFDGSFDALLSRSDPYLEELDWMDQQFPLPATAAFIFVAAEGETVFDRKILLALDDLRANYRAIPTAWHLATVIDWISPQTQRRLFAEPVAQYSPAELAGIGRIASRDRLLTNNLLAPNGRLMFARLSLDARDAEQATRRQIAGAIESLRDELRARHPDVRLFTGSDLILEQSQQQAMVEDLTRLLPVVIVICVLVMCYCFRSLILGACILIHGVVTVAATIGLINHLGYAFNSISVIAPLIVIIVAIANCVHIISLYRQALQQGKHRLAAMQHSLAGNWQPVSLAALTTAIGFSSLNMTSSPAIQDFGQIVALGIVLSYVLGFTMLPAVMLLLTRRWQPASLDQGALLQGCLRHMVRFAERHDSALFHGCTGLALVTLLLLPLNETDFNRLDFIANEQEIRQYYDEIAEQMDRGPALSYAIATGVENGILDSAFLRQVERFGDWLLTEDLVESQASLVEVLKTIHQFVNEQNPAYYTLPESSQTISNYLDALALVNSREFPVGGFVNQDFSTITLVINARQISNQQVIDLDQRITDRFPAFFTGAELIHGSELLVFSRMDELVTMELLQGYSVSLLLITISLVIGLGSWYFGLLSVVPNLLPATIVFGCWALLVGQLDPFVMMLFSISIGLVVDDTVHILSHYLQRRRHGAGQSEAIAGSIQLAGPALTITTMVLALGTTILVFANTSYFQQSAQLLVPIVVLALLLDLLYLPTVLRRFDRKPASSR